tara:strand:+ start:284 stop:955 length:672 start_codon:yes stop_codon:yes gene_type:complete
MQDFKVFIGYDSREDIAYQVARYSIHKHNPNVEVVPLKLHELREQGFYTRADDKKGSTEFTITRFLPPALMNYKGYALFMDCDMLVQNDITYIMNNFNTREVPVSCVQHDYSPKTMTKMDGKMQHVYPRKNWSSVMLFNNEKCKNLTPEVVNTETPLYLHRMLWADEVGKLDHTWNHLIGYYDKPEESNIVHYTDGGPWFANYRKCEYHEAWTDMCKEWLELD